MSSPARVERGRKQSIRLGEQVLIPLALADSGVETRVYLKHNGLFYLQPLGDVRTEVRWDQTLNGLGDSSKSFR